ncbi:SURF1 family cytochrome oxidase biogenesis protein, partial [Acinetobacter baumannii]
PPLLVDRGWVPLERSRPVERPGGVVSVTGYIRPGESAGSLAARDDAAGRRFYTFDPIAIGRALGLPEVAPFGLVALAPPGAPPDLLPAAAR